MNPLQFKFDISAIPLNSLEAFEVLYNRENADKKCPTFSIANRFQLVRVMGARIATTIHECLTGIDINK